MSWVSVQEDIIKRFESSLNQLRDLPNAAVLENRCKVLLKDLRERLRTLDGEGHINWRFSELHRKFEEAAYDLTRYKARNAELRSETNAIKSELAATKKNYSLLAQSLKSQNKESEKGKNRISELEREIDSLKGQFRACTKQIKVLEQRALAVKIVEYTSNVCPKCRKREVQPHTHED